MITVNHDSNLRNLATAIEKLETAQNTLYVLSKIPYIDEMRGYNTKYIGQLLAEPNFLLVLNIIKELPCVLYSLLDDPNTISIRTHELFVHHLSVIGQLSDVDSICNLVDLSDLSRHGNLVSDKKHLNITVGKWVVDGNIATLPNQLQIGYYDNVTDFIKSMRWFYDTLCILHNTKLAVNQIDPILQNEIADFIWKYVKGHATCYIPKDKITEDITHQLKDDEFLYTEELRSNKLDMFTGFFGMYHEICNNHKNPIVEYINTH